MNQEPPDTDLERLLYSYFAQREQRPLDFERFWHGLDAALDAASAAGTDTSLVIGVAQCATSSSNGAAPDPFNLADDEAYDFVLDDTLEESMSNGHDQPQQPSTTERSTRLDTPRRGLGPRATAIAGIAAALILVVIATTIYTQFAARRTPPPAATATPSVFTRITLPEASTQPIDALTTAPDGSLWYANSIGRNVKIGHVKPDGTVVEFPVPLADTVKGIMIIGFAYMPDSGIWFSGNDYDGSTYTQSLRRVSPDGAVTVISLPASLTIGAMVAGPDGALWFNGSKAIAAGTGSAQSYISLIGKITSDGSISEYPIPSQDKGSNLYLCAGPDQAIWYTWISSVNDLANLKGRIGRMSLSGQAQEFSVPYPPETIISGPDGALWYSERDPATPNAYGTAGWRKGFVGRITTAGVASEVPIDPNTGVSQIVAGSDGGVWYTVQEGNTGTFGRITPGGGVKTFATPGGVQINTLSAGPGALWMVDATNTLWRFTLPK